MITDVSLDCKSFCIPNKHTPRHPKEKSVHYSNLRFKKAEEQASMAPVPIPEVIRLVNEFLCQMGMSTCENPILHLGPDHCVDYKKIKEDHQLRDVKNIVWMKSTNDGFLGVVAVSNDIGFDIPKSRDDYNATKQYSSCTKWLYTTAGIIIHHLGKQWDDSFALVFPLKNFPGGFDSHNIETGIGNYLIAHNVSILDFYSHNY